MTRLSTAYMSFLPMNSRVYPDAQVLPMTPIVPRYVSGVNVRAAMDFTLDTTYQLDLTSFLSANPPTHGIQAMYVNAANMTAGSALIEIQGSTLTQLVIIQPQTQGYYPIICQTTGPLVFTFDNQVGLENPLPQGAISVPIALDVQFLTIPVVASVWHAQYPYFLPTSPHSVQSYAAGSSLSPAPVYQADKVYSVDAVNPASGASGRIIPITAPTGHYFIQNITASFDPTTACGNNYLAFLDSVSGQVWGTHFSFPSTKPSSPVANVLNVSTPPGFLWVSSISGSFLYYTLYAALNGGVTFNISYGVLP